MNNEIELKSAYEILKHVFETIHINAIVTCPLPNKQIVKIIQYIKKHGGVRHIEMFHVKYDHNLINFTSSLAFSYNPIVFCTMNEFKYNLSGCAHSLTNHIPLIIAIVIPSSSNTIVMEDFANDLCAIVSKSIFNISTCKEMMQIFIAAMVVSRSRKGGPAPVIITIRDDVFRSHASIIKTIQNPAFNEDLDLISIPLDTKYFYKKVKSIQLIKRGEYEKKEAISKDPCKWLDGLLHHSNMSIFMDFSSYIIFGNQILTAAKKYSKTKVNIPSRTNDDLGCVPRAVGMALANRNNADSINTTIFPIVIFATLESLLQNVCELKICVEKKLPIIILICRRNNYCPILNVGLCGSLHEIKRLLDVKHDIRVLSRYTNPTDMSRQIKRLKTNPTLMLYDATQAMHYPISIYYTTPLTAYMDLPVQLGRGEDEEEVLGKKDDARSIHSNHGISLLIKSLIMSKVRIVLMLDLPSLNNEKWRSFTRELNNQLNTHHIRVLSFDMATHLLNIAHGLSSILTNGIVSVLIPSSSNDNIDIYTCLRNENNNASIDRPILLLSIIYQEEEDVGSSIIMNGDKIRHDSFLNLLCTEVYQCCDGNTILNTISRATLKALESNACVGFQIHMLTLLQKFKLAYDAISPFEV